MTPGAQFFWPSVNVYPIDDATDLDLDAAVVEVEEVIGHGGPALWPKGNFVWPGIELEEAMRDFPEGDYIGATGSTVKLWEGSPQDLYSRLDFERNFSDDFDENTIRRTGRMRGGR